VQAHLTCMAVAVLVYADVSPRERVYAFISFFNFVRKNAKIFIANMNLHAIFSALRTVQVTCIKKPTSSKVKCSTLVYHRPLRT